MAPRPAGGEPRSAQRPGRRPAEGGGRKGEKEEEEEGAGEEVEGGGDTEDDSGDESGEDSEGGLAYWSERLEVQREVLLREHDNYFKQDPAQVAEYHVRQLELAGIWHLSEYSAWLRGAGGAGASGSLLRPMVRLVDAALRRARVDVLAHGNVNEGEALEAAQTLRGTLAGPSALRDEELPTMDVVLLPAGPGHAVAVEFDLLEANPIEENSAAYTVLQVGPLGEDPHRDACLEVVAHLASNSAFAQLRTKEQLGYVVYATRRTQYDVASLAVVVQGATLGPRGMDARVEAWLTSFREELAGLSEEDFATNLQGVIDLKSKRHTQLGQEVAAQWQEILQRTCRFDRRRAEVAALRAVSRADLLAFFDRHLAASAPLRRKLSSWVQGAANRGAGAGPEGPPPPRHLLRTIDEWRAFKNGLPTHSVG